MKNVLQTTMLLTVMAVLLLTIIVPQKTEAADSLNIMADAAILVDADSGKIFIAQNADAPLGIASMTKMMSEYLLFEAIEEGSLALGPGILGNRLYI